MGRFESLALGYAYPFRPNERPEAQEYREVSNIIELVYYHLSEISQACSGESSPGPGQQEGCCISELDFQMSKSPLFKRVVELLSSDDVRVRTDAHCLVERLHEAWKKSRTPQQDSDAGKELTDLVLQTLLPERYSKIDVVASSERRRNALQRKHAKLSAFKDTFPNSLRASTRVTTIAPDVPRDVDVQGLEYRQRSVA